MLSISRFVRPSVCLSVCPSVCSLLRYCLNVFLPPLPEVGCPIFLEIRNPWGKVMERSGLRYEHFCLKIVLNRRAKKSFFLLLILPWSTLLWHRCYYPHRSRDALSPVCGIFSKDEYEKKDISLVSGFMHLPPQI